MNLIDNSEILLHFNKKFNMVAIDTFPPKVLRNVCKHKMQNLDAFLCVSRVRDKTRKCNKLFYALKIRRGMTRPDFRAHVLFIYATNTIYRFRRERIILCTCKYHRIFQEPLDQNQACLIPLDTFSSLIPNMDMKVKNSEIFDNFLKMIQSHARSRQLEKC